MQPDFTLGQFVEGTVRMLGWDAPRDGQTAYLSRDRSGLLVSTDAADGVRYTWPRGRSHQEASLLAIRHWERKSGQTF